MLKVASCCFQLCSDYYKSVACPLTAFFFNLGCQDGDGKGAQEFLLPKPPLLLETGSLRLTPGPRPTNPTCHCSAPERQFNFVEYPPESKKLPSGKEVVKMMEEREARRRAAAARAGVDAHLAAATAVKKVRAAVAWHTSQLPGAKSDRTIRGKDIRASMRWLWRRNYASADSPPVCSLAFAACCFHHGRVFRFVTSEHLGVLGSFLLLVSRVLAPFLP